MRITEEFLIIAFGPMLFAAITVMLSPYASRFGLVDLPGGRKRHEGAVPLLGGLSMFVALLISVVIFGIDRKLELLLSGSALIVFIGFLDDLLGVGIKVRLLFQSLAVGIMIFFAGVYIPDLGVVGGKDISLHWFSYPFTYLCALALINSFNMIDGVDGLASGIALIALMGITISQFLFYFVTHPLWLLVLFAIIVVFWLFNMSMLPFERIFLGDAGSLFLGYVIAWCLIDFAQEPGRSMHPVMSMWCVAYPAIDLIWVLTLRYATGKTLWSGDRLHIHHYLVDSGIKPISVTFLCMGAAFLTMLLGVLVTNFIGPATGFVLFTIMGLVTMIAARRRVERARLVK